MAENSGGLHCFKYGFTTNYVTGLEIVLSDGEVVTLGGKELDRPGYDLVGTFVGSEGTLGIATKITLRVTAGGRGPRTMVGYFDCIEQAGQAVTDIVGAGMVPAAIEIMDKLTIEATENWHARRLSRRRGAALIVELDGSQAECEARFDDVMEIYERNGATGTAGRPGRGRAGADLEGPQGRLRGHGLRLALLLRAGQRHPPHPPGRGAEADRRALREYGFKVANVFHAGDGNLHPLVCYDARNDGGWRGRRSCRGRSCWPASRRAARSPASTAWGSTRSSYAEMFSEQDLAFQRLRCAFDPDQLANPGKVMPTPRLCGEVPGPYRKHPLEQAGIAERF